MCCLLLMTVLIFQVILHASATESNAGCFLHAKVTLGKGSVDGTSMGTLDFCQLALNGDVQISGILRGITPVTSDLKLHGLHVHVNGSGIKKCDDAGPHYNPFNKDHGDRTDENRHVGDLGNIIAGQGSALVSFVMPAKFLQLSGEQSIIGRMLVIHEGEDDLGKGSFSDSKTTGHAGARLGCGVIEIVVDPDTTTTPKAAGQIASNFQLIVLATVFAVAILL